MTDTAQQTGADVGEGFTQLKAALNLAAQQLHNRDLPGSAQACWDAAEDLTRLQAELRGANASHAAIEALFPNWASFRDLADCVTVTVHRLEEDQDRWRRTAERLEAEKQRAEARIAELEAVVKAAKTALARLASNEAFDLPQMIDGKLATETKMRMDYAEAALDRLGQQEKGDG